MATKTKLVEQATAADAGFIAKACQYAERAHTGEVEYNLLKYFTGSYAFNLCLIGIGYFDLLLSNHSGCDISKVLEHVCEHDTNSILHYSRFFVIRDSDTKQAVATLCGFMSPYFGVASAKPGIFSAMNKLYKIPYDECVKTWENVSFLPESFPEDVPYPDNTWIIEAVYTEPAYRGFGYASLLLNAMFEKGRNEMPENEGSSLQCKQCFICCADGNTSAMSLYIKNGFHCLGNGSGTSEICLEKLKTKGFHVLERKYK